MKGHKAITRKLGSIAPRFVSAWTSCGVKPGASIGISAPADLSKITATDLLRHADSAMYENKSIRKAANTRGLTIFDSGLEIDLNHGFHR